MLLDYGREICGDLATAESREWLCTNGMGGFASGTVAGILTRRYHGLLVAALAPPVGRTLLVAKLEETAEYDGIRHALGANRWADGTIGPRGYQEIERFRLEGTTPVWTYALADALVDKRVWMEQGANTTYVRYRVLRARGPVRLVARALVNYRDYHTTTRGEGAGMKVSRVAAGIRVLAYDGARPFVVQASGSVCELAQVWYRRFDLARERERGLDAVDDHLHAGTFTITLSPGEAVTFVMSAEAVPALDGEAAWWRRREHEAGLRAAWRRAHPAPAPVWIDQLVLAADQFLVTRGAGLSIIAGYPWFADWGRDTMIALPGLLLVTGRAEPAARILTTFARFVDRGMLPNRFPDAGEPPEYNTVDATLWYVEAVRAYHAVTRDRQLLGDLFPVLEDIYRWHREGTRHAIGQDPADGLLRAGEPSVQLTWMDAKVGDWVVTPRIGKPVEVNALWYNALRSMAGFARALGRPADGWDAEASRVAASFEKFWNPAASYCYDVIDGPDGHEAALRPNQILAVSLTHSPLPVERRRGIVDACAARLLTSFGLRSLAPGHPDYQGRCAGGPRERDAAYHQGTVWGWLLGPFALAHLEVHGDPDTARSFLEPIAHHLDDHGLGSIAEIFDGDPPFRPAGCFAQAWSVAETLRAWSRIEEAAARLHQHDTGV